MNKVLNKVDQSYISGMRQVGHEAYRAQEESSSCPQPYNCDGFIWLLCRTRKLHDERARSFSKATIFSSP